MKERWISGYWPNYGDKVLTKRANGEIEEGYFTDMQNQSGAWHTGFSLNNIFVPLDSENPVIAWQSKILQTI